MLYLLLALFTAAIVAVDQLTKYLAAANLVGKTVTLIPGWLQLHYITNDGMALSLLRGARWLFVVMTAVYLAVVIYVLVKKWFKKTPELWCIVGLGLIGGSLAKAYHEAGEAVLAFDTDRSILDFAMMSGAVDGVLDEESIKRCDIVLIAVYPAACIEYFTRMADYINKDTVVLDCCGTKRTVCEGCFPVAKAHGIAFAGGHPMAGTHNSGFKYARANLFHGAPMVIVPMDFDNIALLSRIEKLLAPAGFGSFSVTTAGTVNSSVTPFL